MILAIAASAALTTVWMARPAGAQVGVPELPADPSAVQGAVEAAPVPEVPQVPVPPAISDAVRDLPVVPQVVDTIRGGGTSGGGSGTSGTGGSNTGGSGASSTERGTGSRPTAPSTPGASSPARSTARRPATRESTAPTSKAARSGPDTRRPDAADRDPTAGGVNTTAGTVATADGQSSRETKDIITRIIEVLPFWAKLLMLALTLALITLAAGAHLSLRRRAAAHRHQAFHDGLTDLPNRNLFRDHVAAALGSAAAGGEQIAVLLVDLDSFREINDTLGHANGDQLLRQVAARLTAVVRADDTVARLGGDEFAVLLPAIAGEAAAVGVGESLRHALRDTFTIEGIAIHADASVGVAVAPHHGADADTLIRHADVAMYLAKESRAGTVAYESARDHYNPERLALIGELRRAIDHDELVLHYQPQIEPVSGRVSGVEALVRWHHPERGMVPPGEFVPIAERTGLIQPLTRWVLETAIRQCATWRGQGLDLRVSANLSAANLVDREMQDAIEGLLRRWALPAGFFRLEITETTAMADPIHTRSVLERLDLLGVELAIDDFGTGYSSLSYLRRLPVHELKIDRSFVSTMTNDPSDEVIVGATIELGHRLGLRVVAEGVEDEETLRELIRRGCDLAQGYLFSKPLSAADLQTWLVEWAGPHAPGASTRRDHQPAALGA